MDGFRLDGDYWVIGDRRFPRQRGAEGEPEPTTQETQPQPEAQPEAGEPSSESPPWGDDFNPERAWSTIQTQRQSEAQLKQQVQELQQYRDVVAALQDPEQQAAILAQLGLELEDEEQPEEFEEPEFLTRAQIEQMFRERDEQSQATDLATEISQHIDQLAEKAKVKLSPQEKQFLFFQATSGDQVSPEATEQVFQGWHDGQKQTLDGRFEEWRQSKLKAPHSVSKVGSQATEDVLPLDASHADRVKFMVERAQLADGQ